MAPKSLKSFDDIFGDKPEDGEKVVVNNEPQMLPIEQLKPYAKKRFALYSGERLKDMIESVRKNGILQPIIARSLTDQNYEILAGHNRVNAAKIAGLDKVPAYIMENISDEAAEVYYFETNLLQRSFSDLTHSEKAAVLTAYHSKLFSQGKRNDILDELEELAKLDASRDDATSAQFGRKLESREKIGQEYGLSKNTVARYLRINKLIEELKPLVDDGSIPFMAGVDISYLSLEHQQLLLKYLTELKGVKLDLKKSGQLKAEAIKNTLNDTVLLDILTDRYKKQQKPPKINDVKIKKTVIKKYFKDDTPAETIEETIENALELYFSLGNKVSNSDEEKQII